MPPKKKPRLSRKSAEAISSLRRRSQESAEDRLARLAAQRERDSRRGQRERCTRQSVSASHTARARSLETPAQQMRMIPTIISQCEIYQQQVLDNSTEMTSPDEPVMSEVKIEMDIAEEEMCIAEQTTESWIKQEPEDVPDCDHTSRDSTAIDHTLVKSETQAVSSSPTDVMVKIETTEELCDPPSDVCTDSEQGLHQSSKHTGLRSYVCDQCEAAFKYPSSLKDHMLKHTGQKPYKCDNCEAAFTRSHRLKLHMQKHEGETPYKCGHCDAAFTDSKSLRDHKQFKHVGQRPHACHLCEAAFNNSNKLKVHLRTHTGEKPYKCEHCDAAFTESSKLTAHRRKHTGERPYTCDQCEDTFKYSNTLRVHKRRHSGHKPFKCDLCDAAFAHLSTFKHHKHTHAGQKPYSCDCCKAGFMRPSSLKLHQQKHTKEGPYACDQCDATFAFYEDQKRHKLTHVKPKQTMQNRDKELKAVVVYMPM